MTTEVTFETGAGGKVTKTGTGAGVPGDPWVETVGATLTGGGDASAANQTAGNATLTAIDGKTPALGQAVAGASTPVVLPAAQITTLTPPAAITGFATETTLAAQTALMGAVNETAPATDTASSGHNGRLQRIAQRLTSLITLLPTALGSTTAANSFPVTLSSDGPFSTLTGAVTETAPASDTASSGTNGRLQRIAQRITSLIALLPATLSNGFFQVSVKETITLPASQSGVWTVQPGNTANTTAWKVDGSAVTQPIGGNVASGATDSGNPVKAGGVYNTALPTLTNGQRGDLQLDANGKLIIASTNADPATGTNQTAGNVLLGAVNETAPASDTASSGHSGRLQRVAQNLTTLFGRFAAAAALADATALPTTTIVGSAQHLYNGATLDLTRNNTEGTALASAPRTATTASAEIVNYNGSAILWYLNVTAASGTGGLQAAIQIKDPVSGVYSNLSGLPTAVIATGQKAYGVWRGAGAGGGLTNAYNVVLPRTFRINVTHGDASSYTYSVGYSIING